MIETILFVLGVVIGVCAVLGIQWIYRWIDRLHSQVESLRWELDRLSRQQEDWYEFHDWKRMNKKQKE